MISYWKEIWVGFAGVWRTFRKGAEFEVTQIEPQICNDRPMYALTVMTCVLPAGLPRVLLIGQTARPYYTTDVSDTLRHTSSPNIY
jgi:hypothetical protein